MYFETPLELYPHHGSWLRTTSPKTGPRIVLVLHRIGSRFLSRQNLDLQWRRVALFSTIMSVSCCLIDWELLFDCLLFHLFQQNTKLIRRAIPPLYQSDHHPSSCPPMKLSPWSNISRVWLKRMRTTSTLTMRSALGSNMCWFTTHWRRLFLALLWKSGLS